MFDFSNRVVVITGAAGNLGIAVARAFHAAGAKTTLVDRGANRLQQIYPDLADSRDCLLATSVDLNDTGTVEKMVNDALSRFGQIDALINTAGGYRAGIPLHETSPEDWEFLFNLNARSTFIACRAVIPHLLQRSYGKIVNVASRAALGGDANAAVYSASKTAVVRLTESMAAELKDHGINVNCVLPGMIDTPQNRHAIPDADYIRWVSPEALAEVILFLASDSARAIQGAALPVYGRS